MTETSLQRLYRSAAAYVALPAYVDRDVRRVTGVDYASTTFDGFETEVRWGRVLQTARKYGFDVPSHRMRWANEELYRIVRVLKPKTMVETGVWRGLSTSYILQALIDNGGDGKLWSIDLPTFSYDRMNGVGFVAKDGKFDSVHVESIFEVGAYARELVEPNTGLWELILGDATVELPKLLDRLGSIDLFYHDSDHSFLHMLFEYDLAWKHLTPGGFLLSDDVQVHGLFEKYKRMVRAPSVTFPTGMWSRGVIGPKHGTVKE